MWQQILWVLEHLRNAAEWFTACATVGLIYVAWTQLDAIKKTSSADFAHRLSNDLYTKDSRKLRRLLEEGDVTFKGEEKIGQFIGEGKRLFDANELDDWLLGPLEGVGIYVERGAIEMEIAYEMFGWCTIQTWRNEAVQEYVKWQRSKPNGVDVYDKLEEFCTACILYENRKLGRGANSSS